MAEHTLIQCPGCWTIQVVPARYDELGEFYAHVTGHGCFSDPESIQVGG